LVNSEATDRQPPSQAAPSRPAWRGSGGSWHALWQRLSDPAAPLQIVVGFLLLSALVLAVYRPVIPGEFLVDDWRLVASQNPLVTGELTARNLWFQTDFTLSSLALWLEYLAFGQHPGGYHLVNLLLHATSGLLVWRLLAKLRVPGAWLAAVLFALHPVCVNSVARIAEIKNTLSLPLFLLSLLAYLHYETLTLARGEQIREAQRRSRRLAGGWYLLALVAFVGALLSKTSTVMLPVVLLAFAAWRRGRIVWRDWLPVAPFFALAVPFGLMSIWFQKHQALVSVGEVLPPQSLVERLAMAGHVFTFYLGKALLPLELNFVYPRWKLDPSSLSAYWPHVALLAGGLVCWRFRRTWGRPVLFALGCFAITLFPVLGLFDSQFLTVWQVSDHLQYLPLIAPLGLLAAGFVILAGKDFSRIGAAALVSAVAVLAFQHASVFASEEKLMRDTLARNPAAVRAHNDLGVILAKRNDVPGAIREFEAALQLQPGNADAYVNLGQALVVAGKPAEAEAQYQAALLLRPFESGTHKKLAELLRRERRRGEAIFHYRMALIFKPDAQAHMGLAALCYQIGQPQQAIAHYHHALRLEPNNVEALNNLAWVLATCGDGRMHNATEAVRHAEKACALTSYKQARLTGTLAAAYAEAGRYPEAVATGQATVKLANEAGDQSITSIGNQLLILYQENRPYHEPLAARAP
jgi:Flp pilus assembly protein TadD